MPGMWGYVQGRHGDGVVLLLRCCARGRSRCGHGCERGADSARRGRGAGRWRAHHRACCCLERGSDPHSAYAGWRADPAWAARVRSVPIEGCTVKLNVLLRELPNFTARPGVDEPHHYGQINAPLTQAEWKAGYAAARAGSLPERLWCELYFQSVHDATVAPAGLHTMSVFAQYVPYKFASGSWEERRSETKALALRSIGRFCSNLQDAVVDAQVLGPPDIVAKGRPDRRTYLPGRVPSCLHVEQASHRENSDEGRLSVRRVYSPRRKRDRH